MRIALGVVIGYVLGVRAGSKGQAELKDALETLRSSVEIRELASAGLAAARSVLGGQAIRRPGTPPRPTGAQLRRVV